MQEGLQLQIASSNHKIGHEHHHKLGYKRQKSKPVTGAGTSSTFGSFLNNDKPFLTNLIASSTAKRPSDVRKAAPTNKERE